MVPNEKEKKILVELIYAKITKERAPPASSSRFPEYDPAYRLFYSASAHEGRRAEAEAMVNGPGAAQLLSSATGVSIGVEAQALARAPGADVSAHLIPNERSSSMSTQQGLPKTPETIEALARAAWDSNVEIREEFLTVEDYVAFEKAFAAGRAKCVEGKVARGWCGYKDK